MLTVKGEKYFRAVDSKHSYSLANMAEHRRSFISSTIRRKPGIDRHETNIGIYVRKLLKNM